MGALLLCFCLSAIPQVDGPSYEEALDEVDVRWGAGEFEEALEVAYGIRARALDDDSLAAWFLSDLEWLVDGLETATALDAQGREELARAAQLELRAVEQKDTDDQRAFELIDESLALLELHLDPHDPEVLWARFDRAWMIGKLQRRQEFLEAVQTTLELVRDSVGEAHPLYATGLGVEGMAQAKLGRLDAAIEGFRASIEIWEEIDCGLDIRSHLQQRAAFTATLAAFVRNDPVESERLFGISADIIRRKDGEESESYATLLGNWGSALHGRGELARARPMLQRALALKLALLGKGHIGVAATRNNLAVLYLEQGELRQAGTLLEQALADSAPDHVAVTVALNLAVAHLKEGDTAEARAYAEHALELAEGSGAAELQSARWLLAHVSIAEGHWDDAESLLDEPDEGSLGDDVRRDVLRGRLALARGELDDAAELFDRAFGVSSEYLAPSNPQLSSILSLQARVELARGELESAHGLLEAAALRFDTARLGVESGWARATFSARPYHDQLAAAAAGLGRDEEAWSAQERGRGRALYELLADSGMAVTDEERLLGRELAAAERRLEALVASRDWKAAQTERVRVLELDAELATLRLAQVPGPVSGRALTIERAVAALAPDEAYVGWVVDAWAQEPTLWAWALTSSGTLTWVRSSVTPERADAAAAELRAGLAEAALATRPPSFELLADAARVLDDALLAPLAELLDGVAHVIAVPSGPALGVPLDAIVQRSRWTFSYTPSCSTYVWLLERPPASQAETRALLVGDPPFRTRHAEAMEREELEQATPERVPRSKTEWSSSPGALPRLAGTRAEVEGIAAHFDRADVLVGLDARESELLRLAPSAYRTLHFATHALIDDERPENSALVFSQIGLPDSLEAALHGQVAEDGLVTAREILVEWTLDADLVTLSACKTALGRKVAGEGYLGLSNALLQVGARSLLASLWSVDDRATALFMERFYAEWLGAGGSPRRSKIDALDAARTALRDYQDDRGRRPYAHPGAWAAFVLIGDPR